MIFAAALAQAGVAPEEALMVGDRLREDVGGAQAARHVGYSGNTGSRMTTRRLAMPDARAAKPADVLRFLGSTRAQPENRLFVKSCGDRTAAVTIPEMTDSLLPTTPTELPLRPQDEVECRRCEVHCDKVVYPASCVERACPFVYAYEAFGHTYMGCMQRVFDVEIDLDLLRAAEAPA